MRSADSVPAAGRSTGTNPAARASTERNPSGAFVRREGAIRPGPRLGQEHDLVVGEIESPQADSRVRDRLAGAVHDLSGRGRAGRERDVGEIGRIGGVVGTRQERVRMRRRANRDRDGRARFRERDAKSPVRRGLRLPELLRLDAFRRVGEHVLFRPIRGPCHARARDRVAAAVEQAAGDRAGTGTGRRCGDHGGCEEDSGSGTHFGILGEKTAAAASKLRGTGAGAAGGSPDALRSGPMREALPLSGKVALVTGAAIRVGEAIARALARSGADVAVHYRSSAAPAERVADEIRALGRRAVPVPGDLADPSECRRVVRGCLDGLGAVDLLIHSAANFHRVSFAETDEAIWDSAMDLNARAAFLLARECAPMLRKRKGRIVLMSDRMASRPQSNYLAHSVSKAAVEGLVRALAVELAPEVSVNGIAPGAVLVPEGTPAETAARWAARVPLRRLGDPEDVARTVVFLCAGPAYVTGQIIALDGGQSLT